MRIPASDHPDLGEGPVPVGRRAGAPDRASKLRLRTAADRDEAKATVQRVTGELAEPAEAAANDAERLLIGAKQALRRARS